MAFHLLGFHQRFHVLGDPAEAAFEEWAKESNLAFERFGFLRPSISINRLPRFIRYTPDYITSVWLIEVQGCGRDGEVKLKLDKYEALMDWNVHMPLKLWLWNSHLRAHKEVRVDALKPNRDDVGVFDESKPYYRFRWEEL